MLERVDARRARLDPRVKQVMASLSAVHEVVLVVASDGTLAADVRPLVRINVSVIVSRTAGASRAMRAAAVAINSRASRTTSVGELAREAVRQALRQSRSRAGARRHR